MDCKTSVSMSKSTTATSILGWKIVVKAAIIAAYSVLLCGLSAAAQGLVGAPVDIPRSLSAGEVGLFSNFSYDSAVGISRTITLIALVAVMFVPLARKKKANLRLVSLELIGLASIPMAVHLIGTWAINNYGGIGGGF